MEQRAFLLGSYYSRRRRGESVSQRPFRESPREDSRWEYNGARYTCPILFGDIESNSHQEELTEVEQLMVNHINYLLETQGSASVMDYGASSAETVKRLHREFQGDSRVTLFATSLSRIPPEKFSQGVTNEYPLIHYIPGDLKDVLAHQEQHLADDRMFSLTHGVDIFISDNAIAHSEVPGAVLSQIPLLLSDSSIVILGNKHDDRMMSPLYGSSYSDSSGFREPLRSAYERARKRDWEYGLANLQQLGFDLLTPNQEAYNYLIFAGQRVPEGVF